MSIAGIGFFVGLVVYLIVKAVSKPDDPEQAARANRPPPEERLKQKLAARPGDFVKYGYSIDLSDPSLQKRPPDIKVDVELNYRDSGDLICLPVHLFGMTPSLQAVSSGLLNHLGFSLDDNTMRMGPALTRFGMNGYDLSFKRGQGENRAEFRVHIYLAERFAYAFLCGGLESVRTDELFRLLDTVHIKSDMPERTPELTLKEKHWHASVLNSTGLFYFKGGNPRLAVDYFKKAHELDKWEPPILYNYSYCLESLENPEAALKLVRDEQETVQKAPELKARHAVLEANYGDKTLARKILEALFAGPYRDEEEYAIYLNLLLEAGEPDRAFELGGKFHEETGSLSVLLAMVEMRVGRREFDAALELLDQRGEELFLRPNLGLEKVSVLLDAERFTECREFCDRLIERGQTMAPVYYMRARAESAMGLYRAAKESLEIAKREKPDSQEIDNFLTHLSGLLGEGENSSIKTPIEAVPIPPSLQAKIQAGPYPTDHGIYYPYRVRAIQFQPGELFRITDYFCFQVNSQADLQQYQSFPSKFNPLLERMYVNEVHVTSAAGEEYDPDPNTFYVMDRTDSGEASHQKVLNIPLPGMSKGSIAKVILSREYLSAPDEFPFDDFVLALRGPARLSAYYVYGDEPSLAKIRSLTKVSIIENFEENGGKGWFIVDQPIFLPEPRSIHPINFIPILFIAGGGKDWQEIASEYLEEISAQLEPNDQLRELARKTIAGLADKGDQARALFRLVQSEIQYIAIEFGSRGVTPVSAHDTYRNRQGDCKDMAVLLCSLMRAVDLPCHPTLINSGSPAQEELPSMAQFNHMIAYSPVLNQFLDPTIKFHGPDLTVPMELGENRALVLDRDDFRFQELGDYDADRSRMSVNRKVLVKDSELLVEETVVQQGYYAGFFREHVDSIPADYRLNYLREQHKGPNNEMEHFEVAGVEDPSAPIRFEARYRVPDGVRFAEDQYIITLPTHFESQLLQLGAFEGRKHPFQFQYANSLTSRTEVYFDGGAGPIIPKPVKERQKNLEWSVRAEKTTGETGEGIAIEFACDIHAGVFQAEEETEIQQAMQGALDCLNISPRFLQ